MPRTTILPISGSDIIDSQWIDTEASKFLNSSQDGGFLSMMPQDVVEGLKTVEKYSIKKEPSTNAVNKSSCKVFPLSLSEIYSQKALSNYFEEDSQLETIKSEGQQYSYFKQKLQDTDLLDSSTILFSPDSINIEYFDILTRTATFDNQIQYFTILEGKTINHAPDECAFAPCFCI